MIARLEQLGLLEDDVILLDEAALILSALDDPDRDIAACRRELTDISERTRLASRAASTAREQAAVLAAILGDDEGFTGDTHDYDNPANADLAQLLDRRRGLPVTLAILYVAQARRLGWAATALNTPGHILVRIGHETDSVIIDPFGGGTIVEPDAIAPLLARVLGPDFTLTPDHLAPLGNRPVLVRLLTNQATRARRAGSITRALVLYERMTTLAPGFTGLWWERARLEQLAGQPTAARASLAAMLDTTRDAGLRARIGAAMGVLARSIN